VSNTKAVTYKTLKATLPKELNDKEETEENGDDYIDFSGVNSVKMRPVSQKKVKRIYGMCDNTPIACGSSLKNILNGYRG